jgi:hypothetical protein
MLTTLATPGPRSETSTVPTADLMAALRAGHAELVRAQQAVTQDTLELATLRTSLGHTAELTETLADIARQPLEQGPCSHWERFCPAPPGYQRGQRREPQPVRRLVPHRTRELSMQHGVLLPQDKKFGILAHLPTQEHSRDREHLPRHLIHQRDNHPRHRPWRPRASPDPRRPAATHF